MVSRRSFLWLTVALAACWQSGSPETLAAEPAMKDLPSDPDVVEPLVLKDEKWKELLDPSAYHILREEGTEMAFTGKYADNHEKGRYYCAGCGLALFNSEDKFESGTGWPSFTRAIKENRVHEVLDTSLGMVRGEIECARCNGHLGHVFDDGPPPTGRRFCVNSAAMVFKPK